MKRRACLIWLVATFSFLFTPVQPASAQSIDQVLQQHDPTSDPVEGEGIQPQGAEAAPPCCDKGSRDSDIRKELDRISALLDRIARELANLRTLDDPRDASDEAKGRPGKGGKRRDGKAPGGVKPSNPGGPTDLVLSSFNVTGSSHTGPGSDHPELETGRKRMQYVAQAVKQHQVDVVGFQELQGDQLKEFNKLTDNAYGVYPGFKLGRRETVNSIAWRKDKWDLVKPATIKIPYFEGQMREMPVVLLRNKETGQKAYFANFHNPADTRYHHHQERFRDAATRLQVELANRLQKTSGLPVFITGDMNEKSEYRDHMEGGTSLHAAGGRAKPGIDWIFGSSDVKFSDYERDRSPLIQRTTNHPMVVVHARIRAGKK